MYDKEKYISIQHSLFKNISNINYLIIVLIKIRVLIFLVFSQYYLVNMEELSKYQDIIKCRIAFSDTCRKNCQSGKAMRET